MLHQITKSKENACSHRSLTPSKKLQESSKSLKVQVRETLMQEFACLHGEDDRDVDGYGPHHGHVEAPEEAADPEGVVDVSGMPEDPVVAMSEQGALDTRLDGVQGVHGPPESDSARDSSDGVVDEFDPGDVLHQSVRTEEGSVPDALPSHGDPQSAVESERIESVLMDDMVSAIQNSPVGLLVIQSVGKLHLDSNVFNW